MHNDNRAVLLATLNLLKKFNCHCLSGTGSGHGRSLAAAAAAEGGGGGDDIKRSKHENDQRHAVD